MIGSFSLHVGKLILDGPQGKLTKLGNSFLQVVMYMKIYLNGMFLVVAYSSLNPCMLWHGGGHKK